MLIRLLGTMSFLGLGVVGAENAGAQPLASDDADASAPHLLIKNRRNLVDNQVIVVRITSQDSRWRLRQCAGDICENPQTSWRSSETGPDRKVRVRLDRFVGDVDCVTALPRCEMQLFWQRDRGVTVDSLPLHFDPAGPSGITEVAASRTKNLRTGTTVRVTTNRGYIASIRQCTADAAGSPQECTILSTKSRVNTRVVVQRGLFDQDCAASAGACVLFVDLWADGENVQKVLPLHFDPNGPTPDLLDIFMSRYHDLVDGQSVIIRLSGVNHQSKYDYWWRSGNEPRTRAYVRQCAVVGGDLVIASCNDIIRPWIVVVDGATEFDGPVRRILDDETTGQSYDCAYVDCVVVFQIGSNKIYANPLDGAAFRWRTISFDPAAELVPMNPRINVEVDRVKGRSKIDVAFVDLPVQWYAIQVRLCGTETTTGKTRCRDFMSNVTADHYGNGDSTRTIRRAKTIVPGVDCRTSDCWMRIKGRQYNGENYEVESERFRI